MSCTGKCGECLVRAARQPHGPEWTSADGVFIKTMAIPDAGTIVPQHAHEFEHTTLLALGSVLLASEVGAARHVAPTTITVPAGVKHSFTSLEDNTILYCIHNVSRTGTVEIRDEHHLNLN